jgi:hypothetical protein
MLDTRTLALLAPRAGEPNLDRDAAQLADLRAALSRTTTRTQTVFERLAQSFAGRNQAPSTANCDCGA